MEKEKPRWSGPLPRAILVVTFIASWLALAALLLHTIKKIWPAMTVADPASLAAGVLLIPMTVFLIQALIHLPRSRRRAVFLRPRILTSFSIVLLPAFKRLEPGPALDLLATEADRETIMAEAERRMKIEFGLIPRLALLLDNRSPLEVALGGLMKSRLRPVSALGWLFFLIVGPTRQFTRLWGYIFTRLWHDPGPENELANYKRRVAFDLANRAGRFNIDDMDYGRSRQLLARVWRELKRIHSNPLYGQDLGEPLPEPPEAADGGENDEVAAAFSAPWLNPRYHGVYLDLSVTLAARCLDELYDSSRDDDTSLFYPPELGKEVEAASWLLAERTRLQRRLAERAEEGIVRLDGRPVPTWTVNSWLFDIEGDLNYYKQRVAAHHRRCRTAHLMRARRLERGWPEYLRGMAGILHFAEHARRALASAKTAFEAVMQRPEKTHGETLAEAARLHNLMADLHDRLIRLDLTEELEVRPPDMLPLPLAPPASDLHSWLAAWAREHRLMTDAFSALRDKSLTALLWGEDQVAGRGPGGPEGETGEAPPAPGLIPDFVSIRPPVDVPERVYSMADRLKIGFGQTLMAALVLALLLWQSQTLGRGSLVIYNGLGRDVTVWVGDEEALLKPYGRALLNLQPNQVYDILATTGDLPLERYKRRFIDDSSREAALTRSHLIESFTRRLAAKPTTEVYNIAGAAPLMLWWSPGKPDYADKSEEFLGRPNWLTTEADVLFRAPSPNDKEPSLVLSGYGELPPSEMLPAFPSERDKGELIYLHALWDNPGASSFWQWQTMTFSTAQAEILIQRLTREPDFLEKCVAQLDSVGIQ